MRKARQTKRFNPRPALKPGATDRMALAFGRALFQSSPSIEAGRDPGRHLDNGTGSLFQSSPSIEAGRDHIVGRILAVLAVSILAQH